MVFAKKDNGGATAMMEEVVVKTKAAVRVLVVIMEVAAVIMEVKEVQQLQREVAAIAMGEATVVIQVILNLPRLHQTKKPVLMGQHQMIKVIVLLQHQIIVEEQLHPHLQQQLNKQPVLMVQLQMLLVIFPPVQQQNKALLQRL